MKKCIVISTTAGSPKVALQSGITHFVGYGISKAGLNLAVAKFAGRFKEEGLIFVSVTPGMVKTMPGREFLTSVSSHPYLLAHRHCTLAEEEVDKLLEPFTKKIRKGIRILRDLSPWSDLSGI